MTRANRVKFESPPFRHPELVSPPVTAFQDNEPPSRAILKQVQDHDGSDIQHVALAREYLTIVGKSLELQRIAAPVIKEHRSLLTHFALKTDMRFNAEMDIMRF